jgi:hypothetical protein
VNNPRLRLWHNILDDLGPPEGCVLPWWLIGVYCLLFPLEGLRWALDRHDQFDICRMVWKIRGVEYTDQFFRQIAFADGVVFKAERINGRITLTKYNLEAKP